MSCTRKRHRSAVPPPSSWRSILWDWSVIVADHPAKDVLFGPEFQWGQRSNNSDGWTKNDYRVQFSFKYNFSAEVGGK